MKTSISFYPNNTKERKTSQVPLYMRIQPGKTKAETRLGADVSEQEISLEMKYIDVNYLRRAEQEGSPQRTSTILPVGKPAVKFNKHTS